MVAPGKNLEFSYAQQYLERLSEEAPQTLTIREHLKNRPNEGSTVAGSIRELYLTIEKIDYAVIFSRRANTVALMAIYEMPQEEGMFEQRKRDYSSLFAQQAKGKRP